MTDTLDPAQDRIELAAALRDYQSGSISLPDFRRVAEAIVDRWCDPSSHKPPFDQAESPLWNVVWEVITGCHESLGTGGAQRLRAMLEGDVDLLQGGPELRP